MCPAKPPHDSTIISNPSRLSVNGFTTFRGQEGKSRHCRQSFIFHLIGGFNRKTKTGQIDIQQSWNAMEKNSESLLLIGASICQPVKCNSRGVQDEEDVSSECSKRRQGQTSTSEVKDGKRSSKDKCLWFCEELAMWFGCFGNLPSVHIRSRASSNYFKIIEEWFPFDPRNKCCRSLLACTHSTVNICRKVEIFGWNFVRSVHHFVTPRITNWTGTVVDSILDARRKIPPPLPTPPSS